MTSELPVLPSTEFLIPLNEIIVPADRARDLDPAWAEALGLIIAAQGLTNAITVRVVASGGYSLVTGLQRLGAHHLLEWPTIRARLSIATSDDEAKLEEVMENLGREELNALDRCHHLYELKQVHERLYPETKNGGDRGNQHTGGRIRNSDSASDQIEVFGFVKGTAQKTGLSRSVIADAVKIWKGLSVTSRARAAGTWLADHQSSLKQLSAQTPAYQKAVLDCLFASPPTAANVAEALIIIENGRAPSHIEKKFASINKTLTSLKDEEFDSVLTAHEDRILSWLQRKGSI